MRFPTAVLLVLLALPVHLESQVGHPLFKVGMELRPAPSLEGSPASLVWQNFKLTYLEGLKIIKDDGELEKMISSGELVPIPASQCLVVDKRLDSKWHYVLPRVKAFLNDVSNEVCSRFGSSLKINSAVRNIPRQKQLINDKNFNAAPFDGERTSTHLTGASIDLAVVGVSQPITKWLVEKFLALERLGVVDATLENKAQNVLHVTVFSEYLKD